MACSRPVRPPARFECRAFSNPSEVCSLGLSYQETPPSKLAGRAKQRRKPRQKIGPEKLDAFVAKYYWTDAGKYVSHAAPASVFLQYATDEPFLNADLVKEYLKVVSEPKKLKIYEAPHALNAEATRDRIAFLKRELPPVPPKGAG